MGMLVRPIPNRRHCNRYNGPGKTLPGCFSHKNRSPQNFVESQGRASPLAKVEVESVAVTGGMLCALVISDFPQKVEAEMNVVIKFMDGNVS